jgi:hypothetical protein
MISDLSQQLEAVEKFCAHSKISGWVDGWSTSSVRGRVPASLLAKHDVAALAELGCRVALTIESVRVRVVASAESSRTFAVDASGEWADLVADPASSQAALDACAGGDVQRILSLIGDHEVDIQVTVLGPDLAWVRTTHAFLDEFDRDGWLGFCDLLSDLQMQAKAVVVMDAGEALVSCPGVLIHGPDATFDRADLATRCAESSPSELVVPTCVLPAKVVGETLVPVADCLRTIAGSLSWLHLASSSERLGPQVSIDLVGQRHVKGVLSPCPPGVAENSVAIWKWVTESGEPARRHSVTQAASLQVEDVSDLFDRATSILDSAQFLYELTQRGLVQEALAARRAARDSAVSAGRDAADRAKSAARSVVDRTLVVIGASTGVVLASKGELLNTSVALGLLLLAFALTIGAALLAFHFELPAARRVVEVFREEIGLNTEVLLPRDIEAILRLPSLADGATQVSRARRTTAAVIGVAILSIVCLGGLIVWSSGSPSTKPEPATSAPEPSTASSSSVATPPTSSPSASEG